MGKKNLLQFTPLPTTDFVVQLTVASTFSAFLSFFMIGTYLRGSYLYLIKSCADSLPFTLEGPHNDKIFNEHVADSTSEITVMSQQNPLSRISYEPCVSAQRQLRTQSFFLAKAFSSSLQLATPNCSQ